MEPPPALLKSLDKAGIPYEVIRYEVKPDGTVRSPKEDPPSVEKARLRFTAVLKGDYVGHPFRGNQWMTAEGQSRGGTQAAAAAESTRFTAGLDGVDFVVDEAGMRAYMARQHGGKELPAAQKAALGDYQSVLWYEDINATLRTAAMLDEAPEAVVSVDNPSDAKRIVETIKQIDKAFETATLTEPTTVYRGLYDPDGELRGHIDAEGGITDGAYQSTSLNPAVAIAASVGVIEGASDSSRGVVMEIRIPAGFPAIAIEGATGAVRDPAQQPDFSPNGSGTETLAMQGYTFAAEVLLPRNVYLEHVDTWTDPFHGTVYVMEPQYFGPSA